MNDFVEKLKNAGFKPIQHKQNYTLFKSPKGIAIAYNDGNIEGFVKNSKNIPVDESFKTRHLIESLVILGLSITYFTTDITWVDGISMEPTYKNHTLIIRSKSSKDVKNMLVNKNSNIKFISPNGEHMLKRVVAVPGDEIVFQGARIWVNGSLIDSDNKFFLNKAQSFALSKTDDKNKTKLMNMTEKIKLKENEYFVMGDNRENSVDSREYGPIQKSCIISVIDK